MSKMDFLVCSERSGSNLLTKLVDGHSHYCGPSPAHLFRAFAPVLSSYGDLNEADNWNLLVKDVLAFYNCKIGVWNSNLVEQELTQIEPRTLNDMLQYVHLKEARANQKKSIFVKEVKTYRLFDFIRKNFPSSKFVWLVRDPRDMALSWSRSPVHRGDIVRASKIWLEDQKNTKFLFEQNEDRFILLRYEDLITNQEKELRRVCTFLGIEFESNMLDFHKNQSAVQNSKLTDNWKNLDKKIMSKNANKFLKDLDKDTIRFIEYDCGELMTYFGYELAFDKLSAREYDNIHERLLAMERHEKEEYKLIPDSEKTKRNVWYKKFIEISNRQ